MEGYGNGSQPLSFGSQGDAILDYSDYELLKQALQNEKAAPELLQYEDELVQRVNSQLEHQVSTHFALIYVLKNYYIDSVCATILPGTSYLTSRGFS